MPWCSLWLWILSVRRHNFHSSAATAAAAFPTTNSQELESKVHMIGISYAYILKCCRACLKPVRSPLWLMNRFCMFVCWHTVYMCILMLLGYLLANCFSDCCVVRLLWSHGRPHIGANAVSWPPWKNGWKMKRRKHAKRAVFYVFVIFWEQSGQAGVENGAMLTTYLFRYTSECTNS